jgi:hypothetical protein
MSPHTLQCIASIAINFFPRYRLNHAAALLLQWTVTSADISHMQYTIPAVFATTATAATVAAATAAAYAILC